MMRRKLVLYYIFISISSLLWSQNIKVLPDDPRIQKGTIANGFTYYLIDNDIRPGYADFYLVRRVGAVHENKEQSGFNSIIANMGVEGTRNFPNNTIISYFDELGLDHHSDFEIVNGLESSHYKVKNVPVGKSGAVIDSTLLILYNWAVSINLDEEDVDKGKELYISSLLNNLDSGIKSDVSLISKLSGVQQSFSGSDVDNVISSVRGYRAKDIRSFYYKWFSPDRMSLVIVGDIDPKVYDTKIRSLFQALPKFLEDNGDRTLNLVESGKPVISVFPDPEGTESLLSLYFTTPALPQNLRNSAVPYVENYMRSVTETLLMERLSRLSDRNGLFSVQSVVFEKLMGSIRKDALRIDIKVISENLNKVASLVLRSLYSLKDRGFSAEEFERGQNIFFRDLNHNYDWRILTPNSVYADRAISNFLYGTTLASIEMQKEYMDLVRSQIDAEHFNMYLLSFLRDGDNCVVSYTYPLNRYSKIVSPEELEEVVSEAISKRNDIKEEGVSESVKKQLKYPTITKEGSVVSEYPELITGAQVWNLSNGATVVYKQTQVEPNKFVFEAISKGGLTLMGSSDPSREYINEIAAISSIGGVSSQELFLHKKGVRVSLERKFDMNTSSLYGGGYLSGVEEFMRLVNLYFQPIRYNSADFTCYKQSKYQELLAREFSPKALFSDTLSKIIYNESRYVTIPSAEEFENVDLSSAVSFINDRFSNAANFCFVIVGDVDDVQLKSLVNRYIASLPGNATQKEVWMNVPMYLRKFELDKEIVMDMSYLRTMYNLTMITPSSQNLRDIAHLNLAAEIVKKRVCREMEECGFTMDIESDWIQYPEDFIMLSFNSVSDHYRSDFKGTLLGILEDLKTNGAAPIEIKNAKMVLEEGYKRGENESLEFWKEVLKNRFIYGKDFYSKYMDFINEASDEEINRSLEVFFQNSVNTTLTLKNNVK